MTNRQGTPKTPKSEPSKVQAELNQQSAMHIGNTVSDTDNTSTTGKYRTCKGPGIFLDPRWVPENFPPAVGCESLGYGFSTIETMPYDKLEGDTSGKRDDATTN